MPLSQRLVFALGCVSLGCIGTELPVLTEGRLRVSVTMDGLDLDADGMDLRIDRGHPIVVSHDATHITLGAGPHQVALTGVAANCTATGGSIRNVVIESGRTAELAWRITCTAKTGAVEVSLIAEGTDHDPDGYLVSVDNGPSQRVTPGATTTFAPIAGGTRAIHIRDVAANCAVQGPNPSTHFLASGTTARDTIHLVVSVRCTPRFGDLVVITTTSGLPDSDGYRFRLIAADHQEYQIGANDTIRLSHIEAGSYPAELRDIDGFCKHLEAPPNLVSIVGGATTILHYRMGCSPPAKLRVHTPTTGSIAPGGYRLHLDELPAEWIWPASYAEFTVAEGSHELRLSGLPEGCAVTGANPRTVAVPGHEITDVYLAVTCPSLAGRTGADIVVAATGHDIDPEVQLVICAVEQWDCFSPYYQGMIASSQSMQFHLAPGNHYLWYDSVAEHCDVSTPSMFTVIAGQVNAIRSEISCAAPASLRATVHSTGEDLQDEFAITVDGRRHWLNRGVPVTIPAFAGLRNVRLDGLNYNCEAVGPTGHQLFLAPSTIPQVEFHVQCVSLPVLHISVTTVGASAPGSFRVGIDPDWDLAGGYLYSGAITPNGMITIRIYPGAHQVWLDQLPSQCTLTTPNPVQVVTTLATTRNVTFAVSCQ